jgi:hypothetical protein
MSKALLVTMICLTAVSAFVAGLTTPGCASPAPTQDPEYGDAVVLYDNWGDTLLRVHDKEAGVVCFTWDVNPYGGGVDCLPVSETRLMP